MDRAWQMLRDAGVPLALQGTGSKPAGTEMAAAARTVMTAKLDEREREALAAWLFAWHHGWPSSFAASFEGDADTVEKWAASQLPNDDRYLKLRRIAMANLASVL